MIDHVRAVLLAVVGIAAVACAPASTGASEDDLGANPESAHAPPDPADRPGGTGACDRYMASLFGGSDMIAAGSGYEPAGFGGNLAMLSSDERWQGGVLPNQWGHLWGYAMHLYGTPVGQAHADLYVPAGYTKHTSPSGDDAVALFYYPSLGVEQNVTLAVYHLADYGIQTSQRNAAGSIRVGRNGGPTGDDDYYIHSHLEVHRGWGLPPFAQRNKTRLFFHDVFCPAGSSPASAPAGPPSAWTCDPTYYDERSRGAADAGCDCACGALDPDCASALPVYGCASGQSCDATGACTSP